MKDTFFNQDETEPIIADVIRKNYKNDFVPHKEIVEALLDDPIGKDLVERACQEQKRQTSNRWSANKMASNMVQWFSKRITDHDSRYERQFERSKFRGGWAYKPRQKT
ncbi:MAG: hypothetical protein FJ009_05530 [Chloroflexi bacterium]|nr:hypothetical protein [Chloroflexota bacterium]